MSILLLLRTYRAQLARGAYALSLLTEESLCLAVYRLVALPMT
jgi:hypothetical protein